MHKRLKIALLLLAAGGTAVIATSKLRRHRAAGELQPDNPDLLMSEFGKALGSLFPPFGDLGLDALRALNAELDAPRTVEAVMLEAGFIGALREQGWPVEDDAELAYDHSSISLTVATGIGSIKLMREVNPTGFTAKEYVNNAGVHHIATMLEPLMEDSNPTYMQFVRMVDERKLNEPTV